MHRIILRSLLVIAALAMGSHANGEILTFTDEVSYLSALTGFGYVPLVEDFEGSAWDSVRSPASAPSVTSFGITWSGNGSMTTNLNWGRSGYGVYTLGASREFFSCTSEQVLFGMGCWVDANPSFADIVIVVRDRVVAGGNVVGTGHSFIGVIETAGFTLCELHDVSGPDQNPALGADDFTFAIGGPFDDCNGNGFPDIDDIFSGASLDCNGNGIPDTCDFVSGLSDDCSGNGTPDECDVLEPVIYSSGQLSPIGEGFPQLFTIVSPPETRADARLAFTAAANLDGPENAIDVDINAVPIGTIITGGRDCPWLFMDTDELVVPMATFNTIVAGGDATINMVATPGVDPFNCEFSPSYVTVDVTLFVSSAADQDGNGIPDECETLGVATDSPEFHVLALRNTPNPVHKETRISFTLPEAGHVVLAVYDVSGRRVSEIVNGDLPAAAHSYVWDGRDSLGSPVPAGVYFYRLTANGQSLSRKMVLVR